MKFFIAFLICSITVHLGYAQEKKLIDSKATKATKNLYKNLERLLEKGVMFGHHETLSYGVEWKNIDGKRSDIFDVVNDYPAVFGWDLGKIEHRADKNVDRVSFAEMKEQIKAVYKMGGVNTISWHMDNPVTLGPGWDNTRAVDAVLPGGVKNEAYNKWLNNAARYIKRLRGSDGKRIPIIFRPYHELNGGWFWWGKDSTSAQEYIDLYRYTVHYLKDKKRVHNLIYVFNTNTFKTAEEYMERYPGDDVIDIVSFDNYQFASQTAHDSVIIKSKINYQNQLKNGFNILDSVAKAHNKIATFAETGFEGVPDKTWWTNTLWDVIKDYKISYVMLWRNAGWMENVKKFHYYAPYRGQKSAADFQKFYNLEGTLFQKDIAEESLYKSIKINKNIKN